MSFKLATPLITNTLRRYVVPSSRNASKFENVVGGSKLLSDGNRIPMIGLGISRIEGQESVDESIEAALRSGYRLFDTAHIYENEQELGNALKKHLGNQNLSREDIFITTKVRTMNDNTEEWVHKHIEESLTKIQTNYLDMVLVHYPRDNFGDVGVDSEVEINRRGRKAVWLELEKLKDQGIIRTIGVSNYTVYHMAEMKEYATHKPALNQIEYHPYLTQDQVRQYCKENDIQIQAYSSLCWGNVEIINEPPVKAAAEKYNVTPQTILYAFALNGGVGIIPKSSQPKRIHGNLHKSAAVKLTKEELDAIFKLDRNQAFCPRCAPWRCL